MVDTFFHVPLFPFPLWTRALIFVIVLLGRVYRYLPPWDPD